MVCISLKERSSTGWGKLCIVVKSLGCMNHYKNLYLCDWTRTPAVLVSLPELGSVLESFYCELLTEAVVCEH